MKILTVISVLAPAGNNNPFKGTLYAGNSYYPNSPGGYGEDENRNAGNNQAFKGTLYAGNSYYPNAPGHPDGADYKDTPSLHAVPDQDFWMNDGPFQGGGDPIHSSPYFRGAPSGERDGLNFGGDALEGPNVFKDALNVMDIFFGGNNDDIPIPSAKSRRSGRNYSNDHRQGGFGENDNVFVVKWQKTEPLACKLDGSDSESDSGAGSDFRDTMESIEFV